MYHCRPAASQDNNPLATGGLVGDRHLTPSDHSTRPRVSTARPSRTSGLRGWHWDGRNTLVSTPVRCRADEWYLARAQTTSSTLTECHLLLHFLDGEGLPQGQRILRLHAPAAGPPGELLGWVQTPVGTRRLQFRVDTSGTLPPLTEVRFHHVSERDPKCHPLANVPRWSTYTPPFIPRRVVLPADLAPLASHLGDTEVQLAAPPPSKKHLLRLARGNACVLPAAWVRHLDLRLADLEHLAGTAWLLTDLGTTVTVLTAARVADLRLIQLADEHGIMSARHAYADVPTRGFALQDVFPYCAIRPDGRFTIRAIKTGRSWQRYATDNDWAAILTTETPWADRHADILAALRPIGRGEWLTTDVPWLASGLLGTPLAPRLLRHLLRAQLALPIDDFVQYWNRWDDGDTVVRDIGDLARRYAPLHPIRWAPSADGTEHLGVELVGGPGQPLWFVTGRIDARGPHEGIPPEPMMIFMKQLARERRAGTAWSEHYLAPQTIVWQFDTADGQRFAVNYDAAGTVRHGGPVAPPVTTRPPRVLHVTLRPQHRATSTPGDHDTLVLTTSEGLHGDGAFEFSADLYAALRNWIERQHSA